MDSSTGVIAPNRNRLGDRNCRRIQTTRPPTGCRIPRTQDSENQRESIDDFSDTAVRFCSLSIHSAHGRLGRRRIPSLANSLESNEEMSTLARRGDFSPWANAKFPFIAIQVNTHSGNEGFQLDAGINTWPCISVVTMLKTSRLTIEMQMSSH